MGSGGCGQADLCGGLSRQAGGLQGCGGQEAAQIAPSSAGPAPCPGTPISSAPLAAHPAPLCHTVNLHTATLQTVTLRTATLQTVTLRTATLHARSRNDVDHTHLRSLMMCVALLHVPGKTS